jgi:threonine synthase
MIGRLPQLIGVQSENASAIVDAVNGDGVVREGPAYTIADSINVGRPRDATKAVRAMRESGGQGMKVSDDEIIESIGRLSRATGVFAEPAAAAAFAGFAKMVDSGGVGADERVLLMLTGNGLKDVDAARRAMTEPVRIGPDFDEVSRALAKFNL